MTSNPFVIGPFLVIGLCVLPCFTASIDAQAYPARFDHVLRLFAKKADVLKRDDELLELDFRDQDDAKALADGTIGETSGGGGSGGGYWDIRRRGNSCDMVVSKGMRSPRAMRRLYRRHVQISQKCYPFRLFEMTEHDERLELFYLDRSKQTAFWLVQVRDGVQLVLIDGADCQRYTAASFAALAKQHDLKPIISRDELAAFRLSDLIDDLDDVDIDTEPDFDDDLSDHLGIYGAARETLAKLVTLSVDEGRVQIDRDSWKEYLGAETAEELIQRAEDEFRATGLPRSWFRIGDFQLGREYYDFPQIIFEYYLTQLQTNSRYSYAGIAMRFDVGADSRFFNRELRVNTMFNARLRTQPIDATRTGKQEFLALHLHDAIARDTRVHLFEKPGETFSLVLRSGNSNRLFWMFQDKEGVCWLHDVKLGESTSIKSDSFQNLLEQNRELFSGSVAEMFREMGVGVSADMGGPLDIKNTGTIDD